MSNPRQLIQHPLPVLAHDASQWKPSPFEEKNSKYGVESDN